MKNFSATLTLSKIVIPYCLDNPDCEYTLALDFEPSRTLGSVVTLTCEVGYMASSGDTCDADCDEGTEEAGVWHCLDSCTRISLLIFIFR